jgi:hypothetical protein
MIDHIVERLDDIRPASAPRVSRTGL